MALNLENMHTARAKAERIPEDTYVARIAAMMDLGIQPQTDWQTKEPTDSKPRVLITWELPTETLSIEMNDGTVEDKPRWISKEYTLSAHEKSNIVKLNATLNPGDKDLTKMLNAPCMVSVGSTVTGNAKVVSVVTPPKGMPIDELSEDAYFFDFDAPTEETYLRMPQWAREKVLDAENYTGFADAWGEQEEAA